MKEFGELLSRVVGGRKRGEQSVPPKVKVLDSSFFNPIAEPDLARLMAFRIPGVIKGDPGIDQDKCTSSKRDSEERNKTAEST